MPTQLERQNEIMAQMKAMDLETYEEIFRTLTATEFAELYWRMQEVLGEGPKMAMPPDMYNKFTELFWQVKAIFEKHCTPERKAYVQTIRDKTEQEIVAEFAAQQKILQ